MALVPRRCKKCGDFKPLSAFEKFRNKNVIGIRYTCRKCRRWKPPKGYMNKYNKTEAHKKAAAKYRNSEHGKRKALEHKYKKDYDITLEEYDILAEKQNNLCFLCHNSEIGKRLAVDHDHNTGQVRGLLCQQCNCLIGFIENRNISLSNLKKYLEI